MVWNENPNPYEGWDPPELSGDERASLRARGRACPACGQPATEGDRYCEDCGSAPDRSSWVDGPPPFLPETHTGSDGREYEDGEARAENEYRRADAAPVKPVLSLIGQDGNAFVILGRASKALKRAGRGEEVATFMAEATAGDYDHVLQTCMKWFEVE